MLMFVTFMMFDQTHEAVQLSNHVSHGTLSSGIHDAVSLIAS